MTTRKQKFALRHATMERLAKRLLKEKIFGTLRRCRSQAKQMLQGKLARA